MTRLAPSHLTVVADRTLALSEVFGPTVQGEGPSLGRRCLFVRLARCNLDCGEGPGATWCCDTPYTWRWQGRFDDDERRTYDPADEVAHHHVAAIVDDVLEAGVALVVVSGGEPLVQRSGVADLAQALTWHGIAVEVETNGTIHAGPALGPVSAFNVSPKLANSGVVRHLRVKPEVLAEFHGSGKGRFKFVCSDVDDLAEVDEIVGLARLAPSAVWIMPAGTDEIIEWRLRDLAEPAIERGYNLTTRLHVLVWGDQRGR